MRATLPAFAAALLFAVPCLAQTASPGTPPAAAAPMAPMSPAMPQAGMPQGGMPQGGGMPQMGQQGGPHGGMPQGGPQAGPHAMHGMQSPPGGGPGYEQGYRDAMAKMHHDMDIPYSGNPDRDFVAGMIPHHQGAIDMARIELRYGRDPQLRRLAQDIVRAQEKEIAFMHQWQARHGR